MNFKVILPPLLSHSGVSRLQAAPALAPRSPVDCLTLPEEKLDLQSAQSVEHSCLRKLLCPQSSSVGTARKLCFSSSR